MSRILIFLFTFVALLSPLDQLLAQEASNRTYLKMVEIQKLWEEERYGDAIVELENYATKTADEPYDNAIVHQYIAHTYVFLDQIGNARKALETAMAMPELPLQLSAELNLIYGQIVLGDEQFELARDALEFWYLNSETEKLAGHVFALGYANYMSGNLPRAEEMLYVALGTTEDPNDSWYRLYYQVLFEQKKYAIAEEVLLGMLTRAPYKNDYWRLVANHHLQMENAEKALAAITIAYNEGLLEGAEDLKRMIALYGMIEVPEKAARLLKQHLDTGEIESDADMLKRLGDLWLLSRERAKAKVVLEQAAEVAPDGNTYEMLGNIFFEDESWKSAHDSFIKAIEYGGLDEPERIYLLAGISAQRGGMKELARAAFKEARKSDDLRRQADALIKRLDRI